MLGGRSINECFKAVKCFDNNVISIDKNNVKMFLERNGEPIPIMDNDLCAIIRRFDKNGDSRISYKEFEMGMMPRQGSTNIELE
jgi:Ca2+-binding EF-hand superfamily protein